MSKGENYKIIVATDLHYISPQLVDDGNSFNMSIDRGDGKVVKYCDELIDAFIDQAIKEKPDAVILSGDLTFNGAKLSHQDLSKLLMQIKDAGIDVIAYPGNHDLYSQNAVKFTGNTYEFVESVTKEEFEEYYNDLGYSEALARDTRTSSYVYPVSEDLQVLVVDVNQDYGVIKPDTIVWVEEQLKIAQENDIRVIATSHQNLLEHNSMFTFGFTIINNNILLELYEKYDVIVNLSGHIHLQHIATSDNGLNDIATSCMAVTPNQYGVITLNNNELNYITKAVDVSSYAKEKELTDENLLNFAEHSEKYFKDNAIRQVLEQGATQEMADFFADINTDLFSGRVDLIEDNTELFNQWANSDLRLSKYIASIQQAERVNHNELTIKLDK